MVVFRFKNIVSGNKISLRFLLSSIYVPAINDINPAISSGFSVSPRIIYAKIATNPGVNASKGNALLIWRFFNAVITHKNASTPITDLINSIKRLYEFIVSKFTKKKMESQVQG